jgi:hypothetical protein
MAAPTTRARAADARGVNARRAPRIRRATAGEAGKVRRAAGLMSPEI